MFHLTTQSPDQSLTQSPAPSKEMEERIDEMAWALMRKMAEIHQTSASCSLIGETPQDVQAAKDAFYTLAAELGKERDEIRYQAACSGLWYEKASAAGTLKAIQIGSSIYQIPNIDPLVEEIARLKRELAEAREFLAGAQRDANEWNRRWEDNQTKLVNLSSAYQRQKEALERCKRSAEREIAICEGLGHTSAYWPDLLATINAALAETPDVSMWQPIESAPKDGTRVLALWPYSKSQCWFETFWDDDESQGDKPGWYAPEWGHLLDGHNPTHWQPLPPPPALQPDHQK